MTLEIVIDVDQHTPDGSAAIQGENDSDSDQDSENLQLEQ